MVIIIKMCDIKVRDAPVDGSPPKASGKTIVFIPKGVAIIKKNKNRKVLSNLMPNRLNRRIKPYDMGNKIAGIIISLNTDAR
jgi:hypothetical protein